MDQTNDGTPTYRIAPVRINLADLGITLTTLAQGIHQAWADAYAYLETCLLAHTTYLAQKQAFQAEAGRDLESLPTTPDPRDGQ